MHYRDAVVLRTDVTPRGCMVISEGATAYFENQAAAEAYLDMTAQKGRWLQVPAIDGSGSFRAYLATPASGKGPGIVLAQEIFGVNATMRQVADYYAEEGYVVLAPDLFWRQQPEVELGYAPDDWQKAFSLYKGFDEDKGTEWYYPRYRNRSRDLKDFLGDGQPTGAEGAAVAFHMWINSCRSFDWCYESSAVTFVREVGPDVTQFELGDEV